MKSIWVGLAGLGIVSLASCSRENAMTAEPEATSTLAAESETVEAPSEIAEPAPEAFTWPASFKVMGLGYPSEGDKCRRLGESAAVINYLDDSAILVGCPGTRDSDAAIALISERSAKVVGEVDGVTLISIHASSKPAPAAKENESATDFSGSISSRAVARHSFSAKEGQTINVTLKRSGSMYFNVLPPAGQPGDAIYVGSQAIDEADFWSGVAPSSGEYTVIVYLMGNDRDSGAKRRYNLQAVIE